MFFNEISEVQQVPSLAVGSDQSPYYRVGTRYRTFIDSQIYIV